jgi:hypothetical protein
MAAWAVVEVEYKKEEIRLPVLCCCPTISYDDDDDYMDVNKNAQRMMRLPPRCPKRNHSDETICEIPTECGETDGNYISVDYLFYSSPTAPEVHHFEMI